jgi:type I restriction enzyme M protein
MNMILHGIADADIQNDDVLSNPLHLDGGELMRFDRVITNPPFSQNYSKDGMKFTERFRYGFCPETGKKGDLMFLQHMLAVLRTNGMMATVMPHGVLFRAGAEKEIRKGIIEDDLLEAVIGFPPNLFYGTGIPACVLVCRARGAKPEERKDKILFINSDAEFYAGRAQNYLRPEHIEKITSAFDAFEDIPGYAAVVSRDNLKSNDWNLNIRRYADNAPPPEPQDVRAHLLGGIPKAEVEGKKDLLDAHGLKISTMFVERDADYYDFDPALEERGQVKQRIEAGKGIRKQEAKLREAFHQWWIKHKQSLVDLPKTRNLMNVRTDLLDAFVSDLVPVGLLDRFKVAGVIATWWNEKKFDLKTLIAQGFGGLVDGWVDTIEAALADDPLVTRLIPDYLDEVEQARQDIMHLEQDKKGQTHVKTNQLKVAKKQLKELQKDFIKRVREAHDALSDDDCRGLVLNILNEKLSGHLESYVTAHRQEVIAAVENWWDKYRVTLRDIEGERDRVGREIQDFMKKLNYA